VKLLAYLAMLPLTLVIVGGIFHGDDSIRRETLLITALVAMMTAFVWGLSVVVGA